MEYSFLDSEILNRLSASPIYSLAAKNGKIAGRHKSLNRGSSVEFSEYREYVKGDDLRRLDWKTYARTDRYYIKEFEADTNLLAHLVLDASGSMSFSQNGETKLSYAKKILGSLGYLLSKQGDSVGLNVCAEDLILEVKAKQKASHLKIVFESLELSEAKGKTGLATSLHAVAEKLPRRGLVLIASDLFCDLKELEEALQHLKFRKHEVVIFHVLEPAEINFPFEDLHQFEDLEGDLKIVTEPKLIGEEYKKEIETFLENCEQMCSATSTEYGLVQTNEDCEDVLFDWISGRNSRTS